ncbi:hypothetical protein DFH09DRAFT_1082494 [Mycena vulgaris]|nr:hypothetical protein DFH09DRAFT_1082494 [Mycena vulgaris]
MGPVESGKSPKRAGKGVLGRARIWGVGRQYSQEAWGVRRKSRGQQGPRYGPHGGRKIPKTSWVWMHPHGCDVTQAAKQTFINIADHPSDSEKTDFEELLELTGNVPLVISLMASVASYEVSEKSKTANKAGHGRIRSNQAVRLVTAYQPDETDKGLGWGEEKKGIVPLSVP